MVEGAVTLADDGLRRALAAGGVSLVDLQRAAAQIILFGSRAAGLERAGSDWDLLVVGEGRSHVAPGLDLIWVSHHELAGNGWLTSELAGHVARWGRWLQGAPDWIAEVTGSASAAERKARRLATRIGAMEHAWEILPSAFQRKHQALVRRDLQRHALLARGEPVPPSPLLDELWEASTDERGELRRLAQQAGVCTTFFEQALVRSAGNQASA